ncbi:hypothetical protein [Streptomyces sp. Ag109_O5-1]|uniref:hypothetical protein n=1 Tax=Streptomyces sp. Ag109_O5-1 TaxID=1938851 RepID=UPI001C849F49|nr:hypothetical protein [Streptomyces sp. Ag109_O5-1]
MFVLAGGAVGASACAEFDLALVEVLFELVPLVAGDVAVFVVGTELAAFVEMGEVVADDVFVEHGDVAAGGLDVEVAEQSGADVDGESAVDELGAHLAHGPP